MNVNKYLDRDMTYMIYDRRNWLLDGMGGGRG